MCIFFLMMPWVEGGGIWMAKLDSIMMHKNRGWNIDQIIVAWKLYFQSTIYRSDSAIITSTFQRLHITKNIKWPQKMLELRKNVICEWLRKRDRRLRRIHWYFCNHKGRFFFPQKIGSFQHHSLQNLTILCTNDFFKIVHIWKNTKNKIK